MTRHVPLAVSGPSAAAMLDMPHSTFRDLVACGALPPPVTLADGIERWRIDDLQAILSGKAARPNEDLEL